MNNLKSVLDIQNAVLGIIRNNYDHKEIMYIFRFFLSIASTYIRHQIINNKFYLTVLTDREKDIIDFAIDSIAPLFRRNDSGKFTVLCRYFQQYKQDIEENSDFALIYSRRLVVSKVKQEIIEYLKLIDPSGWKIYRNVKMAPLRNPEIGVIKRFDKTFYYYREGGKREYQLESLAPHLPEAPESRLQEWVLSGLKAHRTIPSILVYILKQLAVANYRSFIDHLLLFRSLRAVMGINEVYLEGDYLFNHAYKENLTNSEDYQGLLQGVIQHLNSVLEEVYLRKNKILLDDSERYFRVLSSYFSDLIQDGFNGKLPEYMREHWDVEGCKKHRNRLEYLIKIGREYLRSAFESVGQKNRSF